MIIPEQALKAAWPVLLKSHFALKDRHATLHITCENDANIIVTIMHEAKHALPCVVDLLPRKESIEFLVRDQETLSVVVRREGRVIASGIYEVSLAAVEEFGVVLLPCVESGVFLAQDRDEMTAVTDALVRRTSLLEVL